MGISNAPITAKIMFNALIPFEAKFTNPKESNTNAEASSPIPARSSLADVFSKSLMYFNPTITAIMPIGMFMKKIYCQLMKVVIIPPKTMPSIAPAVKPSEL